MILLFRYIRKVFCFNYLFFQIYSEGIRHIRADKRINEWKAPPRRQIVKCAVNRRQVAVALTGGELVYFELDLVEFYRK